MESSFSQLELGLKKQKENDRNHHLGGRSFYFFDFDDNIALVGTQCILFHKVTGEELLICSGDWPSIQNKVGKIGFYRDYEIRLDDCHGTFRNFRDLPLNLLIKDGRTKQTFIEDVQCALLKPDWSWKGPSWSCFYHATFNSRPVSIITARGHSVETIQNGIAEFVSKGHLPHPPNYLNILPVNNHTVREELGDGAFKCSVAKMKQLAIKKSVQVAFDTFGYNPHHRFGVSDDDPENLHWIWEALCELKMNYPENSFFVIETSHGQFVKHEVLNKYTCSNAIVQDDILFQQLDLF